MRYSDITRGYSTTAKSSNGRNSESVKDNFSKSFISNEASRTFSNDFSSKYDYKNDIASRDIPKIGSSESKRYYATNDSKKPTYDYVPYYKNHTIENRDNNRKITEV